MNSLIGWMDTFMHTDKFLTLMLNQYGTWTYGILFLLIFIETGLVVCPFLPGDSLLVATGALAARSGSGIHLGWLIVFTALAAVLGDTLNYWIGWKLGHLLMKYPLFRRILSQEKMAKAQQFFDRHGGFAIFLGRFIPFIRTFIPFIAGGSQMRYPLFLFYNISGGIAWTMIGLLSGYFFGNIPIIKQHFSALLLVIIAISVLPVVLIWLREKMKSG
ncbi:MAG: VTT domain-containing protein [Sporolactobacillus sp.]